MRLVVIGVVICVLPCLCYYGFVMLWRRYYPPSSRVDVERPAEPESFLDVPIKVRIAHWMWL